MGTFEGHVLPGLFFITFAFWYVIQSFRRFFNSRLRNARFTSTVAFPCDCLCSRLKDLPVEAFVKILFAGIGFSAEVITGYREQHFVILGNVQHATMFFFFGISGIIDILVFYRAPLPPDIDYVSALMAFMVEGLLFKFHLHGRTELDVLLHTFLIYTIVANTVAMALEMKYRHSLLGPLSRSYFLLLQGTWFWHVGFILHNPIPNATPWKEDDHDELLMACLFFVWHCAVNFILILMLGAVIACCYRRRAGYAADDSVSMKRLIHTGANGQTLVALNDDSDLDSDIEFQRPLSRN
ncbi:transmembrane protein 45B-like [Littorina saxatilis]|uniref:Transmembrane protein 45B n=1 Tax=Littorina saxatilis TaxID=31220 RepID=A0AAN9BLW8_9CAEN